MPRDESLKTITKGAGIVLFGTFISKFLALIYRMVVARIGTEEYGLLSLGIAIFSIGVTFSTLGLHLGVNRYVPYYMGKNDKQKVKGTITSALKIGVPLSIFFGGLLFYFSSTISLRLFHNPALTEILKIFSLVIPFSVAGSIFLEAIVGFKKIEYKVFTKSILEVLTRTVLVLILVLLGMGVFGATIAYALGVTSTFFISFYFLEKKVFPILKTSIKSTPITRELFSYSWPLMFAGILSLIVTWTDTLMIGYFLDSSEVGIYNAAMPIATLLFVVPGAFLGLFMPVLTELYGKGEIEEMKEIYKTTTKWIFFINLPLFLLLVVSPKPILRIFFGSEYAAAGMVLSILAIGYFINAIFQTSMSILMTLGKSKTLLLVSTVTGGINIILNYFLIPKHGIIGGAIATAVSLTIGISYSLFAYRYIRTMPITKIYLKSAFSGVVSVLIIFKLSRLFFATTSVYWLFLTSAAFVLSYLFLLLLSKGFDEEDIMILKSIEKKSGLRIEFLRNIIKRFL